MKVSFHVSAERELNDAAEYYESERSGLGAAFLDEAERACDRILRHPDAAPRILGSIRRMLFNRVPYALLYPLEGDTLRILAVMNLTRRPAYWVART